MPSQSREYMPHEEGHWKLDREWSKLVRFHIAAMGA